MSEWRHAHWSHECMVRGARPFAEFRASKRKQEQMYNDNQDNAHSDTTYGNTCPPSKLDCLEAR
eukprot:286705-Prymnesium_polylepis.1